MRVLQNENQLRFESKYRFVQTFQIVQTNKIVPKQNPEESTRILPRRLSRESKENG